MTTLKMDTRNSRQKSEDGWIMVCITFRCASNIASFSNDLPYVKLKWTVKVYNSLQIDYKVKKYSNIWNKHAFTNITQAYIV